MKRIIELEFDDWPSWLDIAFLTSCLRSESCIGEGVKINITDVTTKEIKNERDKR